MKAVFLNYYFEVDELMVFFKSHLSQNIRACALSVMLLNYNCGITSYVLMMRNRVNEIDVDYYTLATMSLLLGLLVGQILFGIFGDTLGRRSSFFGSSCLLLLGSILSVFAGYSIFSGATMAEFCVFRFILGIGAGGMFPLVAAITRESSQEDLANSTIALVFGPFGSIGEANGTKGCSSPLTWSHLSFDFYFCFVGVLAFVCYLLSAGLVAAPLVVYLMTGAQVLSRPPPLPRPSSPDLLHK